MSNYNQCPERETFGAWLKWLFRTYFFRLLGINLLFLVVCIPIVTIPAALCGLHSTIQQYYRKLYAATNLSAFVTEFLSSFVKRTIIIWSIILIPLMIVVWSIQLLPQTLWLSFASILLVAVLLVLSWFIPQLVLLNLDIKQALKNAFLLTGLEAKANLALIAVHAVSMTVVLFGLPVTAFLLLILPVLTTVLTTGITMPVLEKYLVHPE